VKTIEIRQPVSFTVLQNLRGLLIEMRPQEWAKNLLVFTGVIFSRSLTDVGNLWISLLGFVIFCAASSGIYLFNDICDLEADRKHPTKCNLSLARFAMVVFFAAATIGSLALNHSFALVIAVYLVTCVAYSLKLKEIVILDVILISSGFVLRAVSGALLIGVDVSEWLVLCTSMVALLVGFGKRRHELVLLEGAAEGHRRSLSDYSVEFLDSIMAICAGSALITYALYTRAEETVARVGSHGMLITIPFVVYGIFRYLFLIHKRRSGGDPVQILFRDRPTLLNLVLWILTVGLVIYVPKLWHI
jgi:4-hydroxybenzoate polyprenyltransferase